MRAPQRSASLAQPRLLALGTRRSVVAKHRAGPLVVRAAVAPSPSSNGSEVSVLSLRLAALGGLRAGVPDAPEVVKPPPRGAAGLSRARGHHNQPEQEGTRASATALVRLCSGSGSGSAAPAGGEGACPVVAAARAGPVGTTTSRLCFFERTRPCQAGAGQVPAAGRLFSVAGRAQHHHGRRHGLSERPGRHARAQPHELRHAHAGRQGPQARRRR